jgi:hypothetical protein
MSHGIESFVCRQNAIETAGKVRPTRIAIFCIASSFSFFCLEITHQAIIEKTSSDNLPYPFGKPLGPELEAEGLMAVSSVERPLFSIFFLSLDRQRGGFASLF